MIAPAFEMGPIRPPSEAQSLLLRVTRSCPWNRCAFCHTYKGEKFSLRPVGEVKGEIDAVRSICDQIRELSWRAGFAGEIHPPALRSLLPLAGWSEPSFRRVAAWLAHGGRQVFLQDADSLLLKTPALVEILSYLRERLPSIQRVTSYARVRTLARKTGEELRELHQAGLSRLHVGLETGFDPLLAYVQKGATAAEQVEAGRKAVAAGLSLCEYVMPGLGGRRWWREHAVETARVLNQINPQFIRLRTLYIGPGMPFFARVQSGEFERLSEEEGVAEIELFLRHLDGIQSFLASDHILNLLEEVEGKLPEDRERMLDVLRRFSGLPAAERLLFRAGRRLGCFRRLDDLQDPHLRRRVEQVLEEALGPGKKGPPADALDEFLSSLMENFI
ncbi:MAG: radical SAM protein [Deltaproteobacteria bacterium]|nr:radical SAM protein [Deltaproteobacteria bacterium]